MRYETPVLRRVRMQVEQTLGAGCKDATYPTSLPNPEFNTSGYPPACYTDYGACNELNPS